MYKKRTNSTLTFKEFQESKADRMTADLDRDFKDKLSNYQ